MPIDNTNFGSNLRGYSIILTIGEKVEEGTVIPRISSVLKKSQNPSLDLEFPQNPIASLL